MFMKKTQDFYLYRRIQLPTCTPFLKFVSQDDGEIGFQKSRQNICISKAQAISSWHNFVPLRPKKKIPSILTSLFPETLKAMPSKTRNGVCGPCSNFCSFCLSGEAWLIKWTARMACPFVKPEHLMQHYVNPRLPVSFIRSHMSVGLPPCHCFIHLPGIQKAVAAVSGKTQA